MEKIQVRSRVIRAAMPGPPGKEPIRVNVEATAYGPYLAVHRQCMSLSGALAKGMRKFVLTHIPSGYIMKQGLTKPEAVKYAKSVAVSGYDLNFTMKDFKGWPLKKRKEVASLVNRDQGWPGPQPETENPDIPPKLQTLLKDWGITYDELLQMSVVDSVLPGICMNPGCDYTTNVEPDSYQGYCECCQTQSVKSGGVLAGII
jgi:hypothetical protein